MENIITNSKNKDYKRESKPLLFLQNRPVLSQFLLILTCLIISFLFLTVCSQNSFLYKFNGGNDVNWYITMGTGVVNGKVPYKDLFEQKGPLLYLVYALFCWANPFVGVFILELICTTAFLYFAYLICNRYLSNFSSLIAVLIIALLTISSSFNYAGGGAAEEYCLPFLTYLFLCFLEFIQDKKQFDVKRSIAIGVSLAIMFWVKFTLMFACAIFVLIWFCVMIKNKQIKSLFKTIGFALIGFVIVTFATLIYFVIKHGLYDVFYNYFYINIFKYGGHESINNEKITVSSLFKNGNVVVIFAIAVIIALFAIGFILYFFKYKKNSWLYAIPFIFNLGLLIYQKCYIYYFNQLLPFLIFDIALIFNSVKKLELNKVKKTITVSVLSVLCFASSFAICGSTREMRVGNDYYAQLQVADDIKVLSSKLDINSPTLFCYDMYEYGFYTATRITPNVKYYAKNNFTQKQLPEMYNSFDQTITEQKTDFVVCFVEDFEQKDILSSNYVAYKTYTLQYYNNFRGHQKKNVMLLIKNTYTLNLDN